MFCTVCVSCFSPLSCSSAPGPGCTTLLLSTDYFLQLQFRLGQQLHCADSALYFELLFTSLLHCSLAPSTSLSCTAVLHAGHTSTNKEVVVEQPIMGVVVVAAAAVEGKPAAKPWVGAGTAPRCTSSSAPHCALAFSPHCAVPRLYLNV